MKLKSICKILLFLLPLLGTVQAFSVALTTEMVRSAKNIVVMPGSFDPIMKSHLEGAVAALEHGDLVVILPVAKTFHKNTMPFPVRVHLADLATRQQSSIAVPTLGIWNRLAAEGSSISLDFYRQIKAINPNAKISLLVGQDLAEKALSYSILSIPWDKILVGLRYTSDPNSVRLSPFLAKENVTFVKQNTLNLSSTKVRKFLATHLELYLADPTDESLSALREELYSMVPEEVADEILLKGLYIGSGGNNSITPFQRITKWIAQKITRLLIITNIYDIFKSATVSILAKKNLTHYTINGTSYALDRHLGSGLSADAYLLNYEGKKVVLKIARNNSGKISILKSISIHLWAQHRMHIKTPNIISYSENGDWLMSEFIEGPTLREHIRYNGGMSDEIRDKTLDIQKKALQMIQDSNIGLDFAVDNLIVKGSDVYMVDLGPISLSHAQEKMNSKVIDLWISQYKVSAGKCIDLFGK